jgi:twitching motility protein PilT
MEKLNEYLQALLSTCSYELHLEPNKNPYVVSANGTNDVSNTPLLGTQISMMVYPLIPAAVKQELPNCQQVEFVHPHTLGDFNFTVKKSPAGFNVTIRPMLSNNAMAANLPPLDSFADNPPAVRLEEFYAKETPPAASSPATFSNFAAGKQTGAEKPFAPAGLEIEIDDPAAKREEPVVSLPKVETTSVNDPEFMTVFSDTATYEPPLKKSEFAPMTEPVKEPELKYDSTFSKNGSNFGSPLEIIPDEAAAPVESFYQEAVPAYQPPKQETPFQKSFEPGAPAVKEPPVQTAPSAFEMPVQQNYAPAESVYAPGRSETPARARMDKLFKLMSEVGASDLHLSVSMPPMVRKDGRMQVLECDEPVLTPEVMRELLTSIMPKKNQEEFARRNDTDFAYEIPGLARFRANIFADRKGMGGVFRIIPSKILTAEQLGLSQAIMNLCELSKGLVVVTGPTGSGKSTTLCAMIDHINKTRDDHIITIEDPIEFVHENKRCLVNQREVHNHTDSFKDALRAALREDPDILLVGEMRDLETISIAIETAETGHLVFGTLHTTTAASTVDRIIDQFPADRQQQIRVMLSESLKGVIAQTLLPKKGGGRVAALEVLIVTPAISNLIREGKTFQINSSMQTGKQHGMVMLNDALFALVQKGIVEPRDAYIKAVDKAGFEALLTRGGFKI